jgi:hypothetical protein
VRQSGIFKAVYEAVASALAEEGRATGLFSVENGEVRLELSDICQLSQDKNGQRVIVDDVSYEAPARFGMLLALRFLGPDYAELLERAGAVAPFLKDNNAFSAPGCGWHGNAEGVFFLEPEIRELRPGGTGEGGPGLVLRYSVEAALNSERGGTFRRVEKRDIRARSV